MVDTNINYEIEKKKYYKVLLGLLLLTAITFGLPTLFEAGANLPAQMFVAVLKAWLILMYYMHLKGDKLIGLMGIFSLALVLVFFVIVIGFDVANFQFFAESHITSATPTAH